MQCRLVPNLARDFIRQVFSSSLMKFPISPKAVKKLTYCTNKLELEFFQTFKIITPKILLLHNYTYLLHETSFT